VLQVIDYRRHIDTLIIQTKNDGLPYYTSEFEVYLYGMEAGLPIQMMHVGDIYALDAKPNVLISGGVSPILSSLKNVGITPRECDYPKELSQYLHRSLDVCCMSDVRKLVGEGKSVFVKSVKQKHLTGFVVNSVNDLLACSYVRDEEPMYISDPVPMSSMREWRAYFVQNKIFDIRPYKGALTGSVPNLVLLNKMLQEWEDRPISGSIDVATDSKGNSILVEVNDGFALGNYGMIPYNYIHVLASRWFQLHTEGR
jgi:hypothetical protein